jgi:hypothetical protein
MSAPSFWDRRRAAVQAEATAEQRARDQHEAAEAESALEEQSDDEILAQLNLPDPDNLSMGDDFKAFMVKGVPTRLRNRALRSLWRSNPVLACVDGLNDYDGDYLTGSTGNGALATTYQVGKGLLAHVQDVARKAEAAKSPRIIEEEPSPEPEVTVAAAAPAPATEPTPEATEDDTTPTPRRMRFRFDEARA